MAQLNAFDAANPEANNSQFFELIAKSLYDKPYL